MTNARDEHKRAILPIQDQLDIGLTTYDAKDPNIKFPPIEPVRPPEDAPNVLVIPILLIGGPLAALFATWPMASEQGLRATSGSAAPFAPQPPS